jgi:hypothetical protein
MRNSTLLLGALSVAGAAGTAWFGYSWRAESARVTELERELVAHAAARKIETPRPEVAASTQAREPAAEATPAAAPAKHTVVTTAAAQRPEVNTYLQSWAQGEREMLKDPEYRQTQVAEWRRRFASTRADAIRVVGMTAEQADRVIDLWVERNMRFAELGGMTGQPLSEEAQAEVKRAGDAEQAELHRVLGEETYSRWHRYLESGEERAEVGLLRAQRSASAAPLSDEQADALVEVIYTERQRRSADYEKYVKDAGITDRYSVAPQDRQRWLDLEKEANQRIHGAMEATLSRTQLSSLDESLAARLAPVEAALRLQLQGRSTKPD